MGCTALLNYGAPMWDWRYAVCRVAHLRHADYVWRPETHDEGQSYRKAAAMVAGPQAADAYLRFRDGRLNLFYACSQRWRRVGNPEEAGLRRVAQSAGLALTGGAAANQGLVTADGRCA